MAGGVNTLCFLQSYPFRKSQGFVFMVGINCLMINVLPANPSLCGFWLMAERPQSLQEGSQVFKDNLLHLQDLSVTLLHFNQHNMIYISLINPFLRPPVPCHESQSGLRFLGDFIILTSKDLTLLESHIWVLMVIPSWGIWRFRLSWFLLGRTLCEWLYPNHWNNQNADSPGHPRVKKHPFVFKT